MERRTFLRNAGLLALSQLLIGCEPDKQTTLFVKLLKDSIPPQVVDEFGKALQKKGQLSVTPVSQLGELFEQLRVSHKNQTKPPQKKGWNFQLPFVQSDDNSVPDLVTLGDYWLKTAIEQKLIQPIEAEKLKQWSNLPKNWQELVTRNDQGLVDAKGKVWGAPYRWGSTIIVYRRDKFQQRGLKPPQDWADLWRSELKGRISLINQPREVIGLTLKKLGKSYNTEKLQEVPDLEKELRALNQQIKFYSFDRYIEPLIMGDTWVAVGWSSDIIPVMPSYPQFSAIIPQSGTAMWADLWVRPIGSGKLDLASQWIDYCWQPEIVNKIAVLNKASSPITTKIDPDDIPSSLRKLLILNPESIAKNEFLLPISQEANKEYRDLFNKIKG
jgi:putative spermidine/putrescine transport system substrate-binding protein